MLAVAAIAGLPLLASGENTASPAAAIAAGSLPTLADAATMKAPASPPGVNALPTVPMPTISVSPRIHYVVGQSAAASAANQGFMSNAGFVITNDGVVVFDSLGSPALARELIRRIREKTDAPIKRVVVSHFHPDHIYGLQVFKALGAEIWAHRSAADYLNSRAASERLAALKPQAIITGHGRHSASAENDIRLTRDYLRFLRQSMGEAVNNLVPFDEAYAATDWSAYRDLPVYDEGNRINAYNTYLQMEQEALKGGQ